MSYRLPPLGILFATAAIGYGQDVATSCCCQVERADPCFAAAAGCDESGGASDSCSQRGLGLEGS